MSTATDERAIVPSHEAALALSFVMEPAEAKMQLAKLQEFVRSVMVEGEDYGTIPGTQKPTLYKPGAEKLCEIYGLTPTFEIAEKIEDWQAGFFYYSIRCTLTSRRTGMVYSQGIGSCNSKETKYRYRWVGGDELPPGLDRSALVQRAGHKWVFRSEVPDSLRIDDLPQEQRVSKKTGKPYMVYDVGSVLYRIENDEGYSVANTVLKMAKKRAHVDATLSATRSSGIFTQDLEDLTEDNPERVGAIEVKSEPAAAPAATQAAPAANGRPKGQSRAQRPQTPPRPAQPAPEATTDGDGPQGDPADVPWSPEYVAPIAPETPATHDEIEAAEDLMLAAREHHGKRYTDEAIGAAVTRIKTHREAQAAIASLCAVVTGEDDRRGIFGTLSLPDIPEAAPYQDAPQATLPIQ